MQSRSRRAHLAALLVALAWATSGIVSHSLWTPDEPVGAAVGRNMLRTGDWITPQFGGEPFLEKPPLYWWVQTLGYRALGVSDATARLPSALFLAATLWLVFAVGRRLRGPRTGWLAMAVLASFVQFGEDMVRAVVDPALVFFVACGWVAIAAWSEAAPGSRRRWLAAAGIGAATALAFLSKGWVGGGLALGAPGMALLVRDRGRALRPLLGLVPWVAAAWAALAVPWIWALWVHSGPGAVRECLLGNTLGRLFGTAAIASYGHRQPLWYYPVQGIAVCLPWVLALPAAWRAAGDEARRGDVAGRVLRLFLVAGAIGVGLLSLAASKRTLYLLPLFPGAAVAVAAWLAAPRAWQLPAERLHRSIARLLLAFAAFLPWLIALAAAGLGFLPVVPAKYASLAAVLRRAPAPAVLAAVAVAAAALGVVVLLGVRRAWRLGAPRLEPWLVVVPALALLLAAQAAFKWAIDPLKTLHDTTAALGAASPGATTLALFRPDTREEKITAIVDYDLGRRIEPVLDEDEATRYFSATPDGALLIASGQLERLTPGFRRTTRVVYDEQGRKATPYAILVAAERPPASP